MNPQTITRPAETIDRKEFMKQVGMSFGGILLLSCLGACTDATEIPDPQPPQGGDKIDFTLNFSSNPALNKLGGFVVNSNANVIVARTLADQFIAVDSKCTHEGTELQYRSNEKGFYCPKHESRFNEAGGVINGPASSPLKKYKTSFDATANTLRVFE